MRPGDPPQDLVIRTDADFNSAVQVELRFGCDQGSVCETDWVRFHAIPTDGVLVWTGALYCTAAGEVPLGLTLTAKRPVQTHERDLVLICEP